MAGDAGSGGRTIGERGASHEAELDRRRVPTGAEAERPHSAQSCADVALAVNQSDMPSRTAIESWARTTQDRAALIAASGVGR